MSVVNSRDLLELHNQARINGTRCSDGKRTVASALSWNKCLARAANNHAQYMAKTNRHSHKGRNGSSFTTRIEQAGYQWLSASENIAYGYKSAESVMQAWLKSKAHCANITNPDVTEMAAGMVEGYWVTVFAKPRR